MILLIQRGFSCIALTCAGTAIRLASLKNMRQTPAEADMCDQFVSNSMNYKEVCSL